MEKRITATVHEEEILNTFLRRQLDMTKHQIRHAKFRENGICVNGERSYTNRRLHPGDIVEIYLEGPQQTALPPSPMHPDVHILYEDDDLIAVTKPSGIVIHPSHGHYTGCLGNMLADYYRQQDIATRIRPIGRLDKDTSGIMIFAKNQVCAARLYDQKKCGRFQKEYLAIVTGTPKPLSGTIRSGICKDETTLMKMKTAPDGQPSVTHYKTLRTSGNYALVSLMLETGRTHQIRVHMASIGHPLAGDALYAPAQTGETPYGQPPADDTLYVHTSATVPEITRTALHAWKCRLFQPFTGEPLQLEAPLPEDMKHLAYLLFTNL